MSTSPQHRARQPRFAHITLQTHVLDKLTDFYTRVLGFSTRRTDGALACDFGATVVEWTASPKRSRPYYHFAINVAENKFEQARDWLAKRVPLLRDRETGSDVIYFANWDAHATYFADPAGNLVEFIARHTLPSKAGGEFGAADLQCVSEVALAPPDPARVFAEIRDKLDLREYLGSGIFLGDENGLVIVFEKGWKWLPDRKRAGAVFPTTIRFHESKGRRVTFADLPYVLEG